MEKLHEEIKESALNVLKNEIVVLNSSRHLCSPLAERIAVKYKLTGTIPEAVNHLKAYSENIEREPASGDLTIGIQSRLGRIDRFDEAKRNDPYNVGIMEASMADDDRKAQNLTARKLQRENKLHDSKQCVCFATP